MTNGFDGLNTYEKEIILRTEFKISLGIPNDILTAATYVDYNMELKDIITFDLRQYKAYRIKDNFDISFNEFLDLPIEEFEYCISVGKSFIKEEEEARLARMKQQEGDEKHG